MNAPRHSHRWRIEAPNGPTSVGVCSSCGEVRTFANWVPETNPLARKTPR